MKRISYVLIFIITMLFVGNVLALPNSFMTTHSGTTNIAVLKVDNDRIIANIEDENSPTIDSTYPYFLYKNSDKGYVICVSGLNVQPPGKDVGFVLIENASSTVPQGGKWEDTQKKGVAYIINTITGKNGGSASLSLEQYYWLEILVNDYLGTYDPTSHSGIAGYANNEVLNTGKTYTQIIDEADKYANDDYNVNLSVSSKNLTFTKDSDGYYVAEVTITSNTNYTIGNISNSKFTYTQNGNVLTFKIKASDIVAGGTESFTITISNSGKEYYVAGQYRRNYHQSGIQDLTLAQTDKITVDGKSETISGSISKELTETVISKVSVVDGKELPGATLQILNDKKEKMSCIILDKDGKQETLKECTWVSGEKPVTVVGLAEGKYHLVETIAPEGYILNESSVEFEVKDDGKTTQVQMKNELYVEVPDTLSGRSALLITIAMIDIALGIGIITYVKKNKITE